LGLAFRFDVAAKKNRSVWVFRFVPAAAAGKTATANISKRKDTRRESGVGMYERVARDRSDVVSRENKQSNN